MSRRQAQRRITSSAVRIRTRDKIAIAVVLAVILGGLGYLQSRLRVVAATASVDSNAIYAGLPTGAGEANAAFRSRVIARFPLLTPENQMVEALSQQGFKSDGWFSKRMTFRYQRGFSRGCDFTASVYWESDKEERVSTLDARFLRRPGCFDSPV
jgi:hypothetical protein